MKDDIPSVGVSVLDSLSVRKVTRSEVAAHISIKFLPPAFACIFPNSVIQLDFSSASFNLDDGDTYTGGSSSANCTNLNSSRSIVQPSCSSCCERAPRTSACCSTKPSGTDAGTAETMRGSARNIEARRIVDGRRSGMIIENEFRPNLGNNKTAKHAWLSFCFHFCFHFCFRFSPLSPLVEISVPKRSQSCFAFFSFSAGV